jgi:hypothetical protein
MQLSSSNLLQIATIRAFLEKPYCTAKLYKATKAYLDKDQDMIRETVS